jgi:tetratricopeptide (TPR) repeat protein
VTSRILAEAIGYLELGMLQDSWNSLEEIPAEERHLPPVLQVRLEIYRLMEKYEGMATVAEHLTKKFPEESQYWISLAYAQRRYIDLQTAEKTLKDALGRFPDDELIHYNLACYSCVSGRIEEGKVQLETALRLDPNLKATALEDEDLVGVWGS